jgi:hypothetical protein
MNCILKYYFSLLFSFSLIPAASLAGQFELSGYAKSFLILQRTPGSNGDRWTLTNPWEVKASYVPKNYLSFNLGYMISPHWDNAAVLAGSRQYRIRDLEPKLWPRSQTSPGNISLWQNLDRAYVRLSFSRADVFMGRQPIAWGSARVVNPTDVIAPYPFNELDTEERTGVDALRVGYSLGIRSEISAGYIAGRGLDTDKSAWFLRAKTNLLKADVTFSLARFKRNIMTGFDLAGTVGGAGVWLEAAALKYGVFQSEPDGGGSLWRLSAGSDFRFSDKIYAALEYHFSAAGEDKPGSYYLNAQKPCYAEGPVYLMARHYLVPSIFYQLMPLLNYTAMPLINLNDGSLVLSQRLEYNLTQNSYLTTGSYSGLGKETRTDEKTLEVLVRSEFGQYGNTLFLSYGLYF